MSKIIKNTKTYTRKDIEERLYDKVIGKSLTPKLLVDSLIESIRELLQEADPGISAILHPHFSGAGFPGSPRFPGSPFVPGR